MITKFEIEQQATRVWQDAYKTVLAAGASATADPDRLTSMARAAAEGAERDYRARCERLRGKEPEIDLTRELSLGFREPSVPAGQMCNVTARPQIVFYGERLVIPGPPDGCAEHFSVLDIKVGNRSQLVESTSVPAMIWVETAPGVPLKLDPAFIAQDIIISVNNDTREPRKFTAILFGYGIDLHTLFDRLGLPLSLRSEPEKDAA